MSWKRIPHSNNSGQNEMILRRKDENINESKQYAFVIFQN
jgi:hypothetical protein